MFVLPNEMTASLTLSTWPCLDDSTRPAAPNASRFRGQDASRHKTNNCGVDEEEEEVKVEGD